MPQERFLIIKKISVNKILEILNISFNKTAFALMVYFF